MNAPALASAPRSLVAAPARFDDLTQQAIERAAQAAADEASREAYARGRRDAAAEQTAAARRALEQLSGALVPPLTAAVDELRALRQQRAEADVELALAIAEAVLGREPAPTTAELATCVRDAAAHLDEPRLKVVVHPDCVEGLEEALGSSVDGAVVTVVADRSSPPGAARVDGRWGRARVSRTDALAAVRAVVVDETATSPDAAHTPAMDVADTAADAAAQPTEETPRG